METTLAGVAARAAEKAWKSHHGQCPRCTRAIRSRAWDDLCRDGAELYGEHRAAAASLAVNRELDKQPTAGQETLF
jgi:hypothetical protein